MFLASVFVVIIICHVWVGYALQPKVIARRGPNALVGLRLPRIMSSDENWLKGHQIAWPWVLSSTLVSLAFYIPGFVLSLSHAASEFQAAMCLSAGALLAGFLIVVGAIRAEKRLAPRGPH